MKKKIIVIITVITFLIIVLITAIVLKNNNSSEEKIKNINPNSSEGKECIEKLNDYLANSEYNDINIIKIEKHEYDIIGDGYAMGTDEKPVVIGHHIFYNITAEINTIEYNFRYVPKTGTIELDK